MITKLRAEKCILAFLLIQFYIKAYTACIEGCSSCNISNNQNICIKCLDDYELDSNNNLCVYTKCSSNLFYDKNQYDANSLEGGCVAICSAFSYKNLQSNICQSKLKCSVQKPTQQYINDITQTKDFFIYQYNYYVVQKETSMSIYDRNSLNLIKNLNFQAKDLNAFQINSIIFLIQSNNSISTWDIIKESKTEIISPNLIHLDSLTQMTSIDNHYVMVFNANFEKGYVFQIFYDLLNQMFSLSNSFTIGERNCQKDSDIEFQQYLKFTNSRSFYILSFQQR
ncbi:hypothetical protein TTHERM_01395380 (macronuclear) [Tetrahymena thermophila SB210]|uniref:Transmembrane protein n=1 Tax=Tetrahymena thermophila (strain SB210) TaxID=312017 RepID=Q22R31_TETTS|nr:hypothetical protein TTHERM_01395380 [Tetrahymena thermophila SB210]EAR87730.3 hypothetical protein TTHERM_01395380 [Tetrahymena thermophila SB210]|eukprot:XP_001007975.3 hypothetical protein TTHERM_01395380 [Tetrahymena thermophila SB210]